MTSEAFKRVLQATVKLLISRNAIEARAGNIVSVAFAFWLRAGSAC